MLPGNVFNLENVIHKHVGLENREGTIMEVLKNSINWFEIPVLDFDRAKLFYSMIYNYEMPDQIMGPIRMGFFLVEKGGIGGAIVYGEGYVPSKEGTLVYLNGGKDLSVVLNRVENAGGKIISPKMKINDELGYIALFLDSEGNRVALHSMK
jgi:predicted enzyme related to lactoylglutathione lyase